MTQQEQEQEESHILGVGYHLTRKIPPQKRNAKKLKNISLGQTPTHPKVKTKKESIDFHRKCIVEQNKQTNKAPNTNQPQMICSTFPIHGNLCNCNLNFGAISLGSLRCLSGAEVAWVGMTVTAIHNWVSIEQHHQHYQQYSAQNITSRLSIILYFNPLALNEKSIQNPSKSLSDILVEHLNICPSVMALSI